MICATQSDQSGTLYLGLGRWKIKFTNSFLNDSRKPKKKLENGIMFSFP